MLSDFNPLGAGAWDDACICLDRCFQVEEKKFFHVRSLIEGALYRQMGDEEFSDQCFKEALARHEGIVSSSWQSVLLLPVHCDSGKAVPSKIPTRSSSSS